MPASLRLSSPHGRAPARTQPPASLSIQLDPSATGNGLTGPTVEPRSGGIQKILVSFDRPVQLAPAAQVMVTGQTTVNGVPGPPVDYSSSAILSLADAQTLSIAFAPQALPDAACLTIDVASAVVGLMGQPISGQTTCMARSLVGDVTGDGSIHLSDAILARMRTAVPVASAPRFDVDLSGVIDVGDTATVKAGITRPAALALCP